MVVVLSAITGCESDRAEPAVSQLTTPVQAEFAARVGEVLSNASLLSAEQLHKAAASVTGFSISPQLPAGLVFNEVDASVTGVADKVIAPTLFEISAYSDGKVIRYPVNFTVGPALPEELKFLATGFRAEKLLSDANIPVRMAVAGDGRLFYAELQTGNIRIVDPQAGLLSEPFVTESVVSGSERGLLGLALDPDFSTNGFVYVNAIVSGHDGEPEHAEIIHYSAVGNAGLDRTVIVDYLPSADIHNGGDLVFDQSGHLFVGRGDVTTPATAQTDGDLSGRVLRYTRDGAIPADNPYAGSAEWCRGLRNTFALTVHPETGDLFGADAGPESDDKLNFLQPGKNFVWGLEGEPEGSGIGYSVRVWDEVITPTALFFHRGTGDYSAYKNKLFVASYNFGDIRIVHVDGAAYTDFIREQKFAAFAMDDFSSKPLHMAQAADGSVYVSTFNAIYRIFR